MEDKTKDVFTKRRIFFSAEQKKAAAKIARDFDRYERKLKIAARIISRQKKELCDISVDLLELKEQNADLEARLKDEQETINELNDGWYELNGENKSMRWMFEMMLKH